MKRNPKAEDRGPKQGRNPKAESGLIWGDDEGFWQWADEAGSEPLALREEPPGKPQPQALEERTLWREAKELNLIFGAIWRK